MESIVCIVHIKFIFCQVYFLIFVFHYEAVTGMVLTLAFHMITEARLILLQSLQLFQVQ